MNQLCAVESSAAYNEKYMLNCVKELVEKEVNSYTMEFFLNVLLNLMNSVTKITVITVKGSNLRPLVHDTAVPAKHMWETESLNWAQFMLQWFIIFPEFAEFTEFNESSVPFRKNSTEWMNPEIWTYEEPFFHRVLIGHSIQTWNKLMYWRLKSLKLHKVMLPVHAGVDWFQFPDSWQVVVLYSVSR